MKLLSLAAVVAIASFGIAPAFADDYHNEPDTIHGWTAFALESSLRDMGVTTVGVEEWSGLIRAWVPNAEGGVSMQFFDPDTLAPVSPTLS